MAKHALLSPSGSARWMACPGSVAITKDMPEEPSPYAAEGTAAHAEAERLIRAFLIGNPFPTNLGKFPELGAYFRYVENLCGEGYLVIPEVRVPLDGVTTEKGGEGTADLIAIKGDTIEIVDLKYGMGVQVEARDNTQMTIYALAALDKYCYLGPFKHVRMTIIQPRITMTPDTWEITEEELEKRRPEIREAAVRAMLQCDGTLQPTFNPTKKGCRFCKARGSCRAYAKLVAETVAVDFPDLGKDALMDLDTRAELFLKLDEVRAWATEFESEMLKEALEGRKFPGLKLVLGRAGARKWKNEQEADDTLAGLNIPESERYDFKLISPTATEKLFKAGLIDEAGWETIKDLVVRPEPKPQLAAASDKRPEYVMKDVKDDFEDLTK